MIPQDPIMLMSYMNTQLRDYYADLDEACDRLDIDKDEVVKKLAAAGYVYDEERHQFR